MGYLAINMSGKIMNVYTLSNGNDIQIGRIYHKERFSCLGRIPYKGATEIKFRNSSGEFVVGYCWPDDNQANDWINYAGFSQVWGRKCFNTDAKVTVRNSDGSPYGTIPAGSDVYPYSGDYTEIGSKYNDHMRVWGASLYGNKLDVPMGAYVDCGIRNNSTNTPVYGNWN